MIFDTMSLFRLDLFSLEQNNTSFLVKIMLKNSLVNVVYVKRSPDNKSYYLVYICVDRWTFFLGPFKLL